MTTGATGEVVFQGSLFEQFEPLLDTSLYAYIGVENPVSDGMYAAVDNVTMTSDAAIHDSSVIPVPEPAAAVLGAFGLLGLLRRRRG